MASHEPIRAKVVIVGAGFGGLCMGVGLKKEGEADFIILEKRSVVGGVWRDNTYPGCTCDVPSQLYSFSFAPYNSCTQRYPPQQEILDYLQTIVTDFGLQPHLRPNTELAQAVFCQENGTWELTSTSGCVFHAEIVIFAVGQLHTPKYPDIPGLERFRGALVHSAEWKHGIEELHGKRISIIGTGSSAAQMLPELASVSSTLTVYQRSPSWVLPKPSKTFGQATKLFLRLPYAHELHRMALRFFGDTFLSPIIRSSTWRSVVEWFAVYNLHCQIVDTTLARRLKPSYPMGSKRIVFANDFYTTLNQSNVELVVEPIKSVREGGIETEGGIFTPTDIIICATGFRATDLLPMAIRGRDGRCLREEWATGAEAFMGLATRGYPNMFMVAGPNSFNAVGSNVQIKELQAAYIVRCLRWRGEINARAIEVTAEAMAQHQEWLQRIMKETVWAGGVDSWYKHGSGKVTNPWPSSVRGLDQKLRNPPAYSFAPV